MSVRTTLWAMALLAMAAIGTPAFACSFVTPRPICDGGAACTDAVVAQLQRERAQREAIEYGRAMAQAVAARSESAGLDRSYDLARILLPNMVLPLALYESSCTGPFGEDEDGGGHIAVEEAEAVIRSATGLAPTAPLPVGQLRAFAAHRLACNGEVRRDLAAYLAYALPAGQLRELWDFLLPRADAVVPTDAMQPVTSGRLLYFAHDGQLVIPDGEEGKDSFIENRRERAWQYLQNHRNGRAVMSAVSQFIQSRLSDGRGEAAICPVAHVETQRLIGELARP